MNVQKKMEAQKRYKQTLHGVEKTVTIKERNNPKKRSATSKNYHNRLNVQFSTSTKCKRTVETGKLVKALVMSMNT